MATIDACLDTSSRLLLGRGVNENVFAYNSIFVSSFCILSFQFDQELVGVVCVVVLVERNSDNPEFILDRLHNMRGNRLVH